MGGQTLDPLTLNFPTTVQSAEHFLAKLKNTAIQLDAIVVSFDVTSLSKSIPKELAETAARESLSQLRDDSNTGRPEDLHADFLHIPEST